LQRLILSSSPLVGAVSLRRRKMSPRFPKKIESRRLLIRVPRVGDGAAFNEAVLESIDNLAPWLDWVIPAPSIQDSERLCEKLLDKFFRNEAFAALIFLKSSGLLLGGTGPVFIISIGNSGILKLGIGVVLRFVEKATLQRRLRASAISRLRI